MAPTFSSEAVLTPPPVLPARYADPVLLGAGGMGVVYRAHDTQLDRDVAVKVLAAHLAQDQEARERFVKECLAAARIGHPHVVVLHDVGEFEGRPLAVMELVAGGSVAQRLKTGLPPTELALAWIAQAASALDAGHACGVVHRDVKPANLLLDAQDQVKVCDFGVARVLDAGVGTSTATGAVLGSVGYAAPECLRGEPAGPQADVWGLGVVAYELLTGQRPFARRGAAGEIAATLHERPPGLSAHRPELAPADAVMAQALRKDPGARPRSAREIARGLASALGAPQTVSESTTKVLPPLAATVHMRPERVAELAAEPSPAASGRGPANEPSGRRGRGALIGAVVGVAVVLAAAIGIGATVMLSGGKGATPTVNVQAAQPQPASPRVVVATVTQPAPVVRTVTRQVPVTPSPPPAAVDPAPAPARTIGMSIDQARQDTERAWSLVKAGQHLGALAVQEPALAALSGSGDPYEANANYNMGMALLGLGRCVEAASYLEQSLALPGGTAFQVQRRQEALDEAYGCS